MIILMTQTPSMCALRAGTIACHQTKFILPLLGAF